jgi:hypothetical protein
LLNGKYLAWKGNPLLMVRIPHPLRSLAWSQLPLRPLHFPHPQHPLPSKRASILHTDNINKPDTSVEHSSDMNRFSKAIEVQNLCDFLKLLAAAYKTHSSGHQPL